MQTKTETPIAAFVAAPFDLASLPAKPGETRIGALVRAWEREKARYELATIDLDTDDESEAALDERDRRLGAIEDAICTDATAFALGDVAEILRLVRIVSHLHDDGLDEADRARVLRLVDAATGAVKDLEQQASRDAA
ncbi:MAG: hypothetical protein ACFE0R_13920 [Salinarimonas sp.]